MQSLPFTIHQGSKPRGEALPRHVHDHAQLTFCAAGTVQVHTDDGRWLVPPQLAVWVPAGVSHRVEMLTDAELWMLHWQMPALQAWAPSTLLARGAFALRITPLFRPLLDAASIAGASPQKTELVARLMLHELTETADAPTFLPWPTSRSGRRLAELAFRDSQNGLDLDELASRAATSVRSASRVFPAETGLTFKAWRQRARIVHAIDLLGRGRSIAQVSAQVGFARTAAFSHAFRTVTAMTPSEFLRRVPTPSGD